VSGVELLMNNHQSLKAEIDTREENFSACFRLGKELLSRNHYASNEVVFSFRIPQGLSYGKTIRIVTHNVLFQIKERVVGLTNQRNSMLHRWEERWEHLQLSKFYMSSLLHVYGAPKKEMTKVYALIRIPQFWKFTSLHEMRPSLRHGWLHRNLISWARNWVIQLMRLKI